MESPMYKRKGKIRPRDTKNECLKNLLNNLKSEIDIKKRFKQIIRIRQKRVTKNYCFFLIM